MATRYYFFRGTDYDSALIQSQIATPLAVLGVTQTGFVVVSIDDTPPNETDLLESMASIGYTFVNSTLTLPTVNPVTDHGLQNAGPTFPTPIQGDRFTNRIMGRQEEFDGTLWNPVTRQYRPTNDDLTIPAALFVNNATGNDANDGFSALTPFATLGRALQYLPTNPRIDRTINLAASGTAYSIPALASSQLSRLTITCPLRTLATDTITSLGVSSYANGLQLSVAGAPWIVDQWRGRMIQFTSGPMNGQFGVVYSNTVNTLFVTQDTRTSGPFLFPAVGNTFNIVSTDCTIDFPAGTTPSIQSSIQLIFIGVGFTGANRSLFLNDTDKVDFRRCRFDLLQLIAGRGGSADLRTCYIRNVGSSGAQNGMLSANTDGVLELTDGTVVEGNAAASAATGNIAAQADSTFRFFGEVVFSGLLALGNSGGFIVRQAAVYTRRITQANLFACLRFVNGCQTGIRVNPNEEGVGGDLDLPDLFGAVASNFGITATGGATVQPGLNSSLTSALGINVWSADAAVVAQIPTAGDGTEVYSPGWPFTRYGYDLLEIPFTFGTASPLVITALRTTDRVVRSEVEITTAFDDPAAAVQLGVVGAPNTILTSEEADAQLIGTYRTMNVTSVGALANVILTLTPAGSTQGAGVVRLQILRA